MIPTIHFILRHERPTADGSAPIYMRVSFNRETHVSLATGRLIPLKREFQGHTPEMIEHLSRDARYDLYYWDKHKERAIKGFGSMESLNLYLESERARANNVLYDLHKRDRLNPESFKKEFLNHKSNALTFLEYCLNEIKENRSEQFAYDTKRSYKSVIVKLDQYRPGIMLKDITYKLLIEYENFLAKPREEGGRGNSRRTIEKNMKVIRTFICIAIKQGDYSEKDYPFKDYKIKETGKYFSTRDFLEPEEILVLEGLYNNYREEANFDKLSVLKWIRRNEEKQLSPGEYKALRAFLLGIYTGLRFRDIITLMAENHLRAKHIIDRKTGERILKCYIEIDLHKTGVNVVIPLIEKAVKLLGEKKTGKLCDTVTNQKMNRHLKSIQKKSGIQKLLTFHVSRHSFATTAFEYGIPEKIVQAILGHRNRRFTEIYTHLSNSKLFLEMDKMNTGYSETELLYNEFQKAENNVTSGREKLLSKLQHIDEVKLMKIIELLDLN